MKHLLLTFSGFLALIFVFTSCGGSEQTVAKAADTSNAAPADEGATLNDAAAKPAENAKNAAGLSQIVRPEKMKSITDLTGYYVGMFGPNKINLVITEINDKKIKGHTVGSAALML